MVIGAMAIRLAPLIEFSLWGSDWGEVYAINQGLVETGSHPQGHLGWGESYVDFPGLADLTGGIALITGIEVSQALLFVAPCITALSCLLVALIVLRLGGGPWAALVSGGVIAFIFPEVFTNSHPVAGPLGSVLLLAVMLTFLMGDVWRWETGKDVPRPMSLHLLMLSLLLALLVTHHMSFMFAIVAVCFAHIARAWPVRGPEPEREGWGIWTIVSMMTLATVYWLVLAPTFREEVMMDLLDTPGWVVMLVAWIGVLLVFILGAGVMSRREGRGPLRGVEWPNPMFSLPGDLRIQVLAFLASGLVIMLLGVTLGFPGTQIEPGLEIVPYFVPVLLAFTLGVGSTDVVMRVRGGVVVVAWVAALLILFLATVAIQSSVLLPYRVLPYIVEVAAVLIGIGAVHMRRMVVPLGRVWSRGYGACIAVLVVVLMVTALPPKGVMGGFQEGTSEGEVSAVLWLGGGLPAPGAGPEDEGGGTVVSDHRLSSIVFGVGGQMATWDRGANLLHAPRGEGSLDLLEGMETPQGRRPVTAVVISEDLRSGVSSFQWEQADPIEDEAWDKFFEPPFVRLYDGGDTWVLGVSGPRSGPGQ